MNKDLNDAINTLNDDLKQDPLIIRYKELKVLIEESKDLTSIRKELKFLQKCDDNEEEKERYYQLMSLYNKNPLVIEFKNVSDEVYNLLMEIKDTIEL